MSNLRPGRLIVGHKVLENSLLSCIGQWLLRIRVVALCHQHQSESRAGYAGLPNQYEPSNPAPQPELAFAQIASNATVTKRTKPHKWR